MLLRRIPCFVLNSQTKAGYPWTTAGCPVAWAHGLHARLAMPVGSRPFIVWSDFEKQILLHTMGIESSLTSCQEPGQEESITSQLRFCQCFLYRVLYHQQTPLTLISRQLELTKPFILQIEGDNTM